MLLTGSHYPAIRITIFAKEGFAEALTQAREGTVAGGGGRSRGTANHCGRDRPTAAGAHRAAEKGRLGNQRDPSPIPLERAGQSLSA